MKLLTYLLLFHSASAADVKNKAANLIVKHEAPQIASMESMPDTSLVSYYSISTDDYDAKRDSA